MTELRDIAASIESIGRNCEWGLIQRREFKLEPISLLRWAGSADQHKLALGFYERFTRLGNSMTGRPGPADQPPERQNWLLRDQAYEIEFHTDEPIGKVSVSEAMERAVPRLRRLAEKLIEDIRIGERIFLYSHAELFLPDDCDELVDALRSVGPATILLVFPNENFAGGVLEYPKVENVLIGYVPFLTRLNSAIDYRWDCWPEMLAGAHALWAANRP